MRNAVDRNAFQIFRTVKRGEKLADADRISLRLRIPSVGGGLRDLSDQGGWRHLSACHSVNGVIDEDDRDVFAAGGRTDRFAHADGREISVALVGKNDIIRKRALDARRDRGSASVGRLDHIAGKIVIRKDGTSDRSDSDRFSLDAQFVDAFRDKAVHDTVRAAGTIMQDSVRQGFRFVKYDHFPASFPAAL